MGMAASQGRLLYLTNRSNTIGENLTTLSLEKQSLARDVSRITKEYNEALNSKIFKWTDNAGATYTNLSYSSLMSPNGLGKDTTYLITDLDGRVVLNNKYEEYAKMLSPDGRAGADWSGDTRYGILSKITGIPEDKLKLQDAYYIDCCEKEEALNNAKAAEPNKSSIQKKDIDNLFSKTGLQNGAYYNYYDVKTKAAKIREYLGSEENKAAFDNALTSVLEYAKNATGELKSAGPLTGSPNKNGKYKFDMTVFIQSLIENYRVEGGEVISNADSKSYNADKYEYAMIWYEPKAYEKYLENYDNWEKNTYTPALESFNEASDKYDRLFTADEKSQIEYYDRMFSAIAEQGWVCNPEIDDSAYLNEMLQNNQYLITTVTRSTDYDTDKEEWINENLYSDTIASNFNKLVAVNDGNARVEAEAEYEYQKSLINAKETRIDTRMKNLETELSAIKQMIEGIEAVRNKNSETYFSIFT